MQLSIIIVSYNVKYFTEQCICSVQKAIVGIDAEIIVIDNNSTDGSREWLEPKFPTVQFIWQNTNDGFGKANNKALLKAGGDCILFLNPDTIIAEDSLQLCLHQMQQDKGIGALGVRMIDGSGKFLQESKRGFPSAWASFYKMSGLTKLFPRSKKFAAYYAGHLPQQQSHRVDVLAGAFMMLSRKAIEATKGFDEDFFMYGEDVDLSYRIQKAGMKNYYFADTTIIHFKGESTQKRSATYNQHFYGAMKLFVQKHFAEKKAQAFLTNLAIAGSKALASCKSLLMQRNGTSSIAQNTVVAATQQECDDCLQLIKYALPPVPLVGRVAVTSPDNTSIGNITDIEKWISNKNIRQIIFYRHTLSYKQIIHAAEKINGRLNMLFHAEGSSSIVGSNDKNSKGFFIAQQ